MICHETHLKITIKNISIFGLFATKKVQINDFPSASSSKSPVKVDNFGREKIKKNEFHKI
jgi:hypothetical protein